MVEVFERDLQKSVIKSSKGNQLKWNADKKWYKADYTGYEGLSEYIISHLLNSSDLKKDEFIMYDTEKIVYKFNEYNGCVSHTFLKDGWQIITLERLFKDIYGESLTKTIYKITGVEQRIEYFVNQIERITGLKGFGIYISKLMTIDALFLNEDRHFHNVAVLTDKKGNFKYCPIFDNGAALLADTMIDYPMDVELQKLLNTVKAKTFSQNFDEQLDAVEKLYGQQIKFRFDKAYVRGLLNNEEYYSDNVKTRVEQLLNWQIGKYAYLFENDL